MRKTVQSLAQTALWSTGLITLVTIPQLVCHAIGAPIHY